jgi:hypothetical protein
VALIFDLVVSGTCFGCIRAEYGKATFDFKGHGDAGVCEIFPVWEDIVSGCDAGTDLRGVSGTLMLLDERISLAL